MDKALAHTALADAARIHASDTLGSRPVIVHPLRNAIRIMSRDHFGIRDRPDLVIAAILHDTVEDRAIRWLIDDQSDRSYDADLNSLSHDQTIDIYAAAFATIAQRYGPQIASHVQYLTREPYPDDFAARHHEQLTDKSLRAAKWEFYRDDVQGLFHIFDAGGAKIVKLSDYVDNFAGAIRYHENPNSRAKFARKYLSLVPTVRDFVVSSRILPEAKKPYVLQQIGQAETIATELLAASDQTTFKRV